MLSFILVDVDADASDQSRRVFALLSSRYINGESPTLMAELWRKELEITRIKRHFQIIYTTKEGFVLMIGSELFSLLLWFSSEFVTNLISPVGVQ